VSVWPSWYCTVGVTVPGGRTHSLCNVVATIFLSPPHPDRRRARLLGDAIHNATACLNLYFHNHAAVTNTLPIVSRLRGEDRRHRVLDSRSSGRRLVCSSDLPDQRRAAFSLPEPGGCPSWSKQSEAARLECGGAANFRCSSAARHVYPSAHAHSDVS